MRWVFLGLLGLFLVLSVFLSDGPVTAGVSAEWANGEYRFSGGTQPLMLVFAGAVVLAFVLLMHTKSVESTALLPGLLRRFVAFWLDFLFAMSALTPVLGILPMMVEWRRAGSFAWSFERTTQVATDIPITVISFVFLVPGLLFYFAVPLVFQRPSPGATIMGYQVVADEGGKIPLKRALLRSLVGYFALCASVIAPFVGRDSKAGKFWLDKTFQTRAVLLQ
jgi:uncharacterized RDD family membrane protein YckC